MKSLLFSLLILLANSLSISAQPAAPDAHPTTIPLADVVARADAAEHALDAPEPPIGRAAAEANIKKLSRELDGLAAATTEASRPGVLLETLRDLEADWEDAAAAIANQAKETTAVANLLEKRLALLPAQRSTWENTLAVARESDAPSEIVQRIEAILTTIAERQTALEKRRGEILTAQSRVAELGRRVASSLEAIRAAQTAAVERLFVADLAPIWTAETWHATAFDWTEKKGESLGAQVGRLEEFLRAKWPRLVYLLLGFFAISGGLMWVRRLAATWSDDDPALQRATPVLQSPVATAGALTFFLSPPLFDQSPRLLWAALTLVALVPIVFILRRLMRRELYPVLYALVAFSVVAQVRKLTSSLPELSRLLLLLEVVGGAVFAVWFLRRAWVAGGRISWKKISRTVARVGLVIFAAIFVALAFGYFQLGDYLAAGSLAAAYFGIMLYAATVILGGLFYFALRVPPLTDLRAVRLHRPLLQRRFAKLLNMVASVAWVLLTLEAFSLRATVMGRIKAVLTAETDFRNLHISLGAVLAFGLTLWAAAAISRFIRFLLREDIYQRFQVASGASYAASTLLHYVILLVGFFVAIAALGMDMTKFTVLAGALGVGIGFGLQNIINNFVSGIILLFERPVNVGDVVQVGTNTGVIQRIGIRASVIRIANASELIVPNSMLISEKVTNWTLSNRHRRIELPVGVAYGTDPQRVIDLLTEVALAHPLAAKVPAAQTIMTGFGADALNFEVRVWTDEYDQWLQIQSDLAVAVNNALVKADIDIPVPQRDLHLKTLSPAVANFLRREE